MAEASLPVPNTGKLRKGNKEYKQIIKKLRAQGVIIDQTKSSHISARLPDGSRITFALSPSDRRAIMNLRSDLKRHDIKV